jgi:histidinol-phosphatase (PHP family)
MSIAGGNGKMETSPARVSVHGGHSGQFCRHASDTLAQIVEAYIDRNFSWVGITEHTPALRYDLCYPDEQEAGDTPQSLYTLFAEYITECRRLQQHHKGQITLYVGMEIETYSGFEDFVTELLERFRPDYLVGSVHFVAGIPFDYSRQEYARAAKAAGGVDALYARYFDLQYAMLQACKPAVVGHFDLIRIFDPGYRMRLQQPEIARKIRRNLEFIRDHNLILDYNLRALMKGADEPYISSSILAMAHDLNIAVVPGDDSHGLDSVGKFIDEGMEMLARAGFDTNWQRPEVLRRGQP